MYENCKSLNLINFEFCARMNTLARFRRRAFHGPTQINKSTPVDADVELN